MVDETTSWGQPGILLLVAGAKGAVGTTVATMIAALRKDLDQVLPWLTTGNMLPCPGPLSAITFSGWDSQNRSLLEAVAGHGVLPEEIWRPHEEALGNMQILQAPKGSLQEQTQELMRQLKDLAATHPNHKPVVVDLLPAAPKVSWPSVRSLEELLRTEGAGLPVDLAYAAAAVRCKVPFVNFTSNEVEHPVLVEEAETSGVPMAGRDGKTGQTFLKVVLASALRARKLRVDGWYSLNILGNEDGRNLSDPSRAAGKLANKTQVLEEVLGYPVGERYEAPCHGVHIAYYPPRGDTKEAWDVVDFSGVFGLPMSLRLNLMARDSVLAAPLVVDLARWMVLLHISGRSGLVSQLAFYFKRPLGEAAPRTFQEQVAALQALERECSWAGGSP